MRVTKEDREVVYSMFDGCCAYCGVELGDRWHVDHIEPVIRNTYLRQPGTPAVYRPDAHRLDNFFPSCAPCNLDKGAQSVEGFRGWIKTHLFSLSRKSIYLSVKRHGLVVETGQPVVFHFERCAETMKRPATEPTHSGTQET